VTDPETIFIILADLLNPYVTGFLYAALLAAIMAPVPANCWCHRPHDRRFFTSCFCANKPVTKAS
jgi:hypothetical protein